MKKNEWNVTGEHSKSCGFTAVNTAMWGTQCKIFNLSQGQRLKDISIWQGRKQVTLVSSEINSKFKNFPTISLLALHSHSHSYIAMKQSSQIHLLIIFKFIHPFFLRSFFTSFFPPSFPPSLLHSFLSYSLSLSLSCAHTFLRCFPFSLICYLILEYISWYEDPFWII